MKLKKVLAGILSAVMVASTIPAGMAFSGVSAEDTTEDGLVASYDLTTQAGRADWMIGSDVTVDNSAGVTVPCYASSCVEAKMATIDNPLKNADVSNGLTIELKVTVPSTDVGASTNNGYNWRNGWEGLFGFMEADSTSYNSSGGYGYARLFVTSNGCGVHYNDWYNNNATEKDDDGNITIGPNFYDNAGSSVLDLTTEKTYTMTILDDTITVYVDDVFAWSATMTATQEGHTPWLTTDEFIASLNTFGLGSFGFHEQAQATFSSVSFYNCVKVPDVEVEYDLTTDEGRADWTAYKVTNDTDDAMLYTATTFSTTDGVTVPEGAWGASSTNYSYVVENPLQGYVSSAYTVSVDAKFESGYSIDDNCMSLFGFNNQTKFTYAQFGTTGTVHTCLWGMTAYDLTLKTDASTNDGEIHRFTWVVDATSQAIYIDGELLYLYDTDQTYNSSETLTIATQDAYFQLGFVAGEYKKDGWAWKNAAATYTNVSMTNTALTASEVAQQYADDVAESLDLTSYGAQRGTVSGTNAVRFIANLGAGAETHINSGALDEVGWAYTSGSAIVEKLTSYDVAALNTVTTAGALLDTGAAYAFTLVGTGDNVGYSVVPYVKIVVNNTSYYYTVDGLAAYTAASSGSATSDEVTTVTKPDTFQGVARGEDETPIVA